MKLDAASLRATVKAALEEDLGSAGDLTTDAVVPAGCTVRAHLVARSELVLAGLDVAREVFRTLDPSVEFRKQRDDGEQVAAGERVANIRGPARAILRGERSALNFLMRMSGIASATRAAVEEIAGTPARILDTRKTAPGLRHLDKYSVAVGGALNHRFGLFDAVMIKDTHLALGGSIAAGVTAALARGVKAERITVEVRNLEQLDEAVSSGAGRVLLDNMTPSGLRSAVRRTAGRVVLEASGGLRPGRLREVAETGVDFLSLGWLTHSAPAANLAMEIEVSS